MPDRAFGGHRLDPEAAGAGIAVAQDMDAACVGGEHTADGGRAFGGEREGEEAARGAGGLLHGGEGDAGLGHEDVFGRVDGADAAQAVEHEDDGRGMAGPGGHELAADKAGAAAIGHDRDAALGAGGDEGCDLGRRAGGDGQALAAPAAARFGEDVVRGRTEAGGGQEHAQPGEEGVVGGSEHGGGRPQGRGARKTFSRPAAGASAR